MSAAMLLAQGKVMCSLQEIVPSEKYLSQSQHRSCAICSELSVWSTWKAKNKHRGCFCNRLLKAPGFSDSVSLDSNYKGHI